MRSEHVKSVFQQLAEKYSDLDNSEIDDAKVMFERWLANRRGQILKDADFDYTEPPDSNESNSTKICPFKVAGAPQHDKWTYSVGPNMLVGKCDTTNCMMYRWWPFKANDGSSVGFGYCAMACHGPLRYDFSEISREDIEDACSDSDSEDE